MAESDPVAAQPPLRDVIGRYGLAARKSLGQHFLLDINLTRRIARTAGDLGSGTIIEVGPGPGGLTRGLLLEGAQRLVAIEKDSRCRSALAELAEASGGRLTIVEADALTVVPALLGPAPRTIVANLPYNVGTALLVGWLQQLAADPGCLDRLVLMFQREVAARLVAAPRSSAYGRLTVLTQWLCHASVAFDVPASAFTPPPKVASTVVSLEPRDKPLAECSLKALERVTAAAFGQRRKMLRQSLKPLHHPHDQLLEGSGVPETRRAEELSVEEFCHLARNLETLDQASSSMEAR